MTSIADQVEVDLARLCQHLTEPGERECLRCFLLRMLDEFGCDGTHRWTVRWRAARAPRAHGLVSRLDGLGGRCDCSVIRYVFPSYPSTTVLLPCAGLPQVGSVAPCNLRPLRRTA
jgi:hypothetical protein